MTISLRMESSLTKPLSTRVLNFDVYHSVWVVRTGPRGYWYADCSLPGGTSVLMGTEAYRPVPSQISTVTKAYRSVCLGVVGGDIFKVLGFPVGMS